MAWAKRTATGDAEARKYDITFHPAFASRCTISDEYGVVEVYEPAASHSSYPKKHTIRLKGGKYDRELTLEIEDPKQAIKQIHVKLHGDQEGSHVENFTVENFTIGEHREPNEEHPAPDEEHLKSHEEHPDSDAYIQRAYYLLARRGFPSDSALADAIGVHRSQVSRWSQGKLAQRENAWLLRDVAAAVARLADHYEPSTIQKWLVASNPELGDEAPIELLRQGRLPEILMAVEAQTNGAFA